MDRLPKDVIVEIMKKLSGSEIINLSSTCKKYFSMRYKYDFFWKLKIKEEFGENYNGNFPFREYLMLGKMYRREFYFLYYDNYANGVDKLIGVYNTRDRAVNAGIDFIKETLERRYKCASPESLKYLFWNTDVVSLDFDESLMIKKDFIGKSPNEAESEKFFIDRESLYLKIFGESSEGASLMNFEDSQKGKIDPQRKTSERFFHSLDLCIRNINRRFPYMKPGETPCEYINIYFETFDFSPHQKEILKEYILTNIFAPSTKK